MNEIVTDAAGLPRVLGFAYLSISELPLISGSISNSLGTSTTRGSQKPRSSGRSHGTLADAVRSLRPS